MVVKHKAKCLEIASNVSKVLKETKLYYYLFFKSRQHSLKADGSGKSTRNLPFQFDSFLLFIRLMGDCIL